MTLVYNSENTYSSNNVCAGSGNSKGIDVEITGDNLGQYFSARLKINKQVNDNQDDIFTFLVTGDNFSKEVSITTTNQTVVLLLED
jgi:hypothetical protein